MRHFDAHAYRTEDQQGVWDFAAGCMRTYLILKAKAEQWNADSEVQQLLNEVHNRAAQTEPIRFTPERAAALKGQPLDLASSRQAGFAYERLDQLTMEILLGVR
jgi:xylose isomerase